MTSLEGKVAIIGAKSILGHALQREFPKASLFDTEASEDSAIVPIDLTNPRNINEALQNFGIDGFIINAAAYNNVDGAEKTGFTDSHKLNVLGPENLAQWMKVTRSHVVHLSRAYVFDGTKGQPYTEEDVPRPVNTYGGHKLEGERHLLCLEQPSNSLAVVMRTDDMYGPQGRDGLDALITQIRSGNALTVINDQIRSPTLTTTLARVVREFVELWNIYEELGGQIYHATSQDGCSRAEFAQATAELLNVPANISPVTTADYNDLFRRGKVTARRPRDVRLSTEKLANLGIETPKWRKDLRNYLQSPQDAGR